MGSLAAGTYSAMVEVASDQVSDSKNVHVVFWVYRLYGLWMEFPSQSSHLSGYLLGSKVAVTQAGTVTHLCLIAKEAGPYVKMALYTDAGGNPGQLVTWTSPETLVVGRMEMRTASAVPLSSGDYWIMAIYPETAHIGFNLNGSAVFKYTPLQFDDPLPTTFPSPMQQSGQEFNYYLRVNVP